MQKPQFHFEGQTIRTGDKEWAVSYPIRDARLVGDRIVVLYEPSAGPRHRQFKNLEAYSAEGERVWTGEHPTTLTSDVYVSIIAQMPLKVRSLASYDCVIDVNSGKLINAEFTK